MPEQLQSTIEWYRGVVRAKLLALFKEKDGEAGLGQSLEALVLIGVSITLAIAVGVWVTAWVVNKESTIAP